jgi:signal transduction histidine kinase
MFTLLAVTWLCGSLALIAVIALARRRRGVLARELHEVRGALTAARLAVDLMPVLDLDRPGVARAASDELERSYGSLGNFEQLLHARLIGPLHRAERAVGPPAVRRAGRPRIDARSELERLALVWGEAARRAGRELRFEWRAPDDGVLVDGPRRCFVEVVANLLANAIRHGEGPVTLLARMRSDSLRIEVADRGPGLPGPLAAAVRRVADRAHGHGLTVAQESAQRLGGTLTSAPSADGARFILTVPALHDPTASRAALPGSTGRERT